MTSAKPQARRPEGLVLIYGVLDLELERHQSMIEFGVGIPLQRH
ncbi:hypothetical protein [Synechococcus sp. UW179A]|nr:hypothetical protein [Synechococcus sp. UW179A]